MTEASEPVEIADVRPVGARTIEVAAHAVALGRIAESGAAEQAAAELLVERMLHFHDAG